MAPSRGRVFPEGLAVLKASPRGSAPPRAGGGQGGPRTPTRPGSGRRSGGPGRQGALGRRAFPEGRLQPRARNLSSGGWRSSASPRRPNRSGPPRLPDPPPATRMPAPTASPGRNPYSIPTARRTRTRHRGSAAPKSWPATAHPVRTVDPIRHASARAGDGSRDPSTARPEAGLGAGHPRPSSAHPLGRRPLPPGLGGAGQRRQQFRPVEQLGGRAVRRPRRQPSRISPGLFRELSRAPPRNVRQPPRVRQHY